MRVTGVKGAASGRSAAESPPLGSDQPGGAAKASPRLRMGWVAAGLVAAVAVAAAVFLVGGSPSPQPFTGANLGELGEAMTREWVAGASQGRFEEIARLTYGEMGEPEALDRLARQLHDWAQRFGPPQVEVGVGDVDQLFVIVCVHADYGEARVDGGMLLRDVEGVGLRLWEFRSQLHSDGWSCAGPGFDPSTTTTQPA